MKDWPPGEARTRLTSDPRAHRKVGPATRDDKSNDTSEHGFMGPCLWTLIQSLPFDVFVLHKSDRYVLANRVCESHYGPLVGRRPKDVARDARTLAVWQANNRRAFAGETIEERVAFPIDGQLHHLKNIIAPVRENGEISHIVGINIDISEAERSREALQISEQRFRTLFDNAPVGLGIVDSKGRIRSVNAKMLAQSGHTLEDIDRLQSASEFYHHSPDRAELYRKLEEQGFLHDYEVKFKRKDGTLYDALISMDPIVLDDGSGWQVLVKDVSAERDAQRKLRESEARFRLAFKNAGIGRAIATLDGRVSNVNMALCEILGYSREEVLSANWLEIIHPDDSSDVVDLAERLVRKELPSVKHEARFRARDGEYRWLKVDAVVLRDGNGEAPLLLADVEDTTDRRKTAATLESITQRYRGIFDHAPVGLGLANADGQLLDINETFCNMLDYRREELVSQHYSVFFHDPGELDTVVKLARKHGFLHKRDVIFQKKSGRIIPVRLSLTPVTIEGQPGWQALVEDTSREWYALRELQKSEEQFQQLAVAIDGVFWLVDAITGELIYVSPGYSRIWGTTSESITETARKWAECLSIDNNTREFRDEEYTPSNPLERIFVTTTDAGDVRWIHSRAFPVLSADGATIRYAGIDEDVTLQKQMENRLREQERYLERLVAERAAQITDLERQNYQIEKLAATGRVAARVAHEINNPLAGIKNAFDLIKDCVPPDHQYFEYVGRIEKEIDRVAGIIRNMFTLYRRESPSRQLTDLAQSIHDVVEMLRVNCKEHDVDIECRLSKVPNLRIPEGSLVQILFNLIQNAIEVSPSGTAVQVSAVIEQDQLLVRIMDEGPGISPDISDRIFEPFFSTKSEGTGANLGLGLSTSLSLAEEIGATIVLANRDTGGVCATVAFPQNLIKETS